MLYYFPETCTENEANQLNSGQTSLYDNDLHTYEEVDSVTAIVGMEQYTAHVTRDLEEVVMGVNLAYGEAIDNTTTVEMKECTAYVTQEEVVMGLNLAYGEVCDETSIIEMKQCTAYIPHKKVVTEMNPAHEGT